MTTGVYLELPEQYTSNSTVIKIVDKALESLNQPTLTEMLQNGITVGELRKLLNASEVIDVLEKIGVDTGALGQVIKVINKLPSIADNLRISIGAPNHAGIYSVTAVTDNKNYNTGVGAGALVLKLTRQSLYGTRVSAKRSLQRKRRVLILAHISRSAGRELTTSPASACSTLDLQVNGEHTPAQQPRRLSRGVTR